MTQCRSREGGSYSEKIFPLSLSLSVKDIVCLSIGLIRYSTSPFILFLPPVNPCKL